MASQRDFYLIYFYLKFNFPTSQSIDFCGISSVFQMSDCQLEQARDQLRDWLNKPMRVSIVDGRVLVGVLLCTDRDQNLILGNCNEYIGSPNEQEEFRALGLALIPGQHIQSIHIDETSSSTVRQQSEPIIDDDKSDG